MKQECSKLINIVDYYLLVFNIFITIGSKDNPIYCAVNRIGEPEYVGANDITLAFAPSGPFDSYGCSHDEGNTFEACKSPHTKQ